eukprot:snap_masked-scaffold_86-processed-gene-0.20-mRNA-1 protein AED:1.00 eAED:1.00 QI:0/-1/0/0/-1/1/1/0/411
MTQRNEEVQPSAEIEYGAPLKKDKVDKYDISTESSVNEQNTKSFKTILLLLVSIVILFAVMLVLKFVLDDDPSTPTFAPTDPNSTNIPTFSPTASPVFNCTELNSQSAKEAFLNSTTISEDRTEINIRDVELGCLSKELMKSLGYQETVLRLIFINVNFQIIEEDALENSTGIKFEQLYFYSSTIGQFKNQNFEFDYFVTENSEIREFPPVVLSERMYLNDLTNFVLTKEFVSFISARPKTFLVLTRFFDDATLVQFRDLVIESQEPIEIIGSDSDLVLRADEITYIPSRFFSSDVFLFSADSIHLRINVFLNLESFDEDAFKGFSGNSVRFNVQQSPKLKRLPKSIEELDLKYLDISSTGIETFDGLDFSGFTSLESIYAFSAPVVPACEDREVFKQSYGIAEGVYITCR